MGRGISAGTMGIVLLAILAGLVGAYLIRASLMREEEIVEAPPVSVVPLAAVDLPPGRTIALGDVSLVQMKPEELAERGWPAAKVMMAPEQIIGRVLREPLKQGKPFLTDILYLEGTRPDFTKELKPGYRSISLPLAKDRGGSLPIGTVVDVMFRAQARKPEPGQLGIPEVTVRLLEGVKIIDVYEPPQQSSGPYTRAGLDLTRLNVSRTPPPPTVTLAVTPEQAEILQTTTGRGELTLVARPPEERLVSAGRRKGLTLEEVLGIEPPKPPPPVILFATEIYRRGARSVNIYRDDKLVEQIRAEQNQQQQQPGDSAVPPPGPQPPAPGAEVPMGAGAAAPVEAAPGVVPAPVEGVRAVVPAPVVPAPAVPAPAAPPAAPMP